MDNEAVNALTPRQFAVAIILDRIKTVEQEINDEIEYRVANSPFNSGIEVFKRQAILELKRAALHLENVPWEDDINLPT